jgi:hypothetical protein
MILAESSSRSAHLPNHRRLFDFDVAAHTRLLAKKLGQVKTIVPSS